VVRLWYNPQTETDQTDAALTEPHNSILKWELLGNDGNSELEILEDLKLSLTLTQTLTRILTLTLIIGSQCRGWLHDPPRAEESSKQRTRGPTS